MWLSLQRERPIKVILCLSTKLYKNLLCPFSGIKLQFPYMDKIRLAVKSDGQVFALFLDRNAHFVRLRQTRGRSVHVTVCFVGGMSPEVARVSQCEMYIGT